MKKLILLLLTISLLQSGVFAQCPPADFGVTSQSDIDNFTKNYPNCEAISGSLSITGEDVTNLLGLSTIKSVGGFLYIGN
ncbi:MAG: hypothetical protein ACXWDO_09175, partial [Bacteroidia bacterium]